MNTNYYHLFKPKAHQVIQVEVTPSDIHDIIKILRGNNHHTLCQSKARYAHNLDKLDKTINKLIYTGG